MTDLIIIKESINKSSAHAEAIEYIGVRDAVMLSFRSSVNHTWEITPGVKAIIKHLNRGYRCVHQHLVQSNQVAVGEKKTRTRIKLNRVLLNSKLGHFDF